MNDLPGLKPACSLIGRSSMVGAILFCFIDFFTFDKQGILVGSSLELPRLSQASV